MQAANEVNGVSERRWRVQGMDCGACALKIEKAVGRLPMVGDVHVSVATEILRLRAPVTELDRIEKTVRSLGYGLKSVAGAPPDGPKHDDGAATGHLHQDEDGHDHAHAGHTHDAAGTDAATLGFWRQPKALATMACGLLLLITFGIERAMPALGAWLWLLPMLVGLVPVARRAIAAARAGSPFSIEMLMTIAAIGAVAIGAMAEAAAVVFLFAVGELLEGVAAGRARRSIAALTELVPRQALLETSAGTETIAAADVRVGQIVQVRPGDRIPADGTIIAGEGAIDEAPVTGESAPKQRAPGDAVYAGTINLDAVLRVEVTRLAADNTIARIIRLVEEAQEGKAPIARFIDRFAAYYTPAIAVAAILVAVLPPLAFGGSWSEWIYKALALLLIACPCALVISTPAAIAAALATGARHGLLVKGGAALEALGKIKRVAFDKTGTLTSGAPTITDIIAYGGDETTMLRLAAAVENGSNHPIARAFLERAGRQGLAIAASRNGGAIAGEAVFGDVGDVAVIVGSPRHAATFGCLPAEAAGEAARLEEMGKTVVAVIADRRLLGLIALRDEPRGDAIGGIQDLRALHIESTMLTGDNRRTATAIGRDLGIDVHAELMPEDKARIVKRLGADGGVAKVGDGINDAPALAAATVGIAMGGGTDVALETADAAILKNSVKGVAELIRLARAALRNIQQNVAIALGLKAFFLVSTLLGLTGLWPAILADTGATVLVTMNALRLLHFKPAARA